MKLILPILLLSLLTLTGRSQDKIVIKGSDTLGAKLIPQLAEAYKEEGNDVSFEIAADGSATAFASLLVGTAEVGLSSRAVKIPEKESFAARKLTLKEWKIGYDLVCVIVNRANPVDALSREQLEGIFAGDITNWSEVGGPPGPISVYSRSASSGTLSSFQEMAMNRRDYGPDTQRMAGNEQVAGEIQKNTWGIGYVGLAYSEKEELKRLMIDEVEPTVENMEEYPMLRPLHFYTIEGKLSAAAERFLEWATSDEKAREVVERVGFLPAS